ncbi:hypothetical protein PBC6_052 [Bacillus phage PBC6]|nr:hypothetical protein PBC6_052 [Bacillus phage PBC6]
MAAAKVPFNAAFNDGTVKIGDVFLYSGSYYEIYKIEQVTITNSGRLRVSGRARRITSPFQTSNDAVLLTPAF